MSNLMEYDKELFIFGEPIETEVGLIRFLSYKEYLLNVQNISMMSMNVLHIYYLYRKMFEKEMTEEVESALEELKSESLFNIVTKNVDFKDPYSKIFRAALSLDSEGDSERVDSIFEDEELFMVMRKLVMDMNMITEEEVNPNPEVQKGIEISRKLKSEGNDSPKTIDIVTSIVAGTSISFTDVCNMTVIQVHSLFYRIGAFKSYDATTLFATVSADVVIESWSKRIDIYESSSSSISKKDFNKQYGSLMN